MIKMPANELTVSNLGSIDELVAALEPGTPVTFMPSVSQGKGLLEHVSEAYRTRLWDFKLIASVAAAGTLALLAGIGLPQYEPLRSSDLYNQIEPLVFNNTMGFNVVTFFGGSMLLISALIGIPVVLDALYARRQNQRANVLNQQGFVFAADMQRQHLVPLQVESAAYVSIKKGPDRTPYWEEWWAVKPSSSAAAYVANLGSLADYVNAPVIIRGVLSSAPMSEDMRAELGIKADLEGSVMGLPMSGQITGEVGGNVYAQTRFRLMDTASGVSVPVAFQAARQGIPHEIRRASRQFGIHPSDRNSLVHLLNQAYARQEEVIVIGTVDESGQVNAEAVEARGAGEGYFLSVYQQPPLLKGR